MKKSVLPRIGEPRIAQKVALPGTPTVTGTAQKLTGGGPIPQLVVRKMKYVEAPEPVGGQSVETVEQFINEGLPRTKDKRSAPETGNGMV
jgi:hypothetical protein